MTLLKYKTNVKYRSDLFSLLSEACELEHGLACSYLYSAFSLKQKVEEGISAHELIEIKKWASQIFYIASQEMLHLAQVWNLLNAIGGTPYYFRPNFPQTNKYYPLNLPLKLEPFSIEALKRFILYELPSELNEKEYAKKNFGFFSEDNYSYKTVGELYRLIAEGFNNIPEKELFIGDAHLQQGPEDIDFREIIKVTDRKTALDAIHMITEQGEGRGADRENCHYTIFKDLEKQYKSFLDQNPSFQPARNCLINPVTFLKGNYAAENGELIVNEDTREASDLFDDVYDLMIRALQLTFIIPGNERKQISKFAIALMIRTIKPLGELLTTLPAYNDQYFRTAGATFALTRHVPLPGNIALSRKIMIERSEQILQRFINLKSKLKNNELYESIVNNYKDLLRLND